ncbi:LysR family transcriptional regulator [Sphingobium aquiterrae]|uniref:LysR family transcriptional regulator n=1 Tax=Sphingobium aquiterrae TaxID=2038656 RepID=UPI00301890E4
MIELRHIRYAIAAADHGSFSRAASALEVDQTNFARRIATLERLLNVKLFTRSRAGVVPTIAGAAFVKEGREIVRRADSLVVAMREVGQGRAGGLTLGHNSPISAGNLHATLSAWCDANPHVEMDRIEAPRETLIAGIVRGDVDIAVLSGQVSYAGVHHTSLWSENVLVAMSDTHRLQERATIEWADLREEAFLLTSGEPGPDIRDMVLGRLSALGSPTHIRMLETSRESMLAMIGRGPEITVLSAAGAGALYPGVAYREIHDRDGPTLVAYSAYWRPGNENPALRRFLAFVRRRYSLNFNII